MTDGTDTIDLKKRKADKLTPVLQVCVVLRGNLTRRIYDTWATQLPKAIPDYVVELYDTFHSSADVVVADPDIKVTSFHSWLGERDFPDSAHLVSSEWIIQTINAKSLAPIEPYLLSELLTIEQSVSTAPSTPGPTSERGLDETPHVEVLSPIIPIGQDILSAEVDDDIITSPEEPLEAANNDHIIQQLEQLQFIYEVHGDVWRSQSYQKAISILKAFPDPITHPAQVHMIKGIGKGTAEKIEEILRTGKVRKLQDLLSEDLTSKDPKLQAMLSFSKIWGVGMKTAAKLIQCGFRSIQELRDHLRQATLPQRTAITQKTLLTSQQKVGLKYYEELQCKIPREEVELIHQTVHRHCVELGLQVESVVCGSYRRGKAMSSDVDILLAPITNRNTDTTTTTTTQSQACYPLLMKLIRSLQSTGFLTDHLALPQQQLPAIFPITTTTSSSSSSSAQNKKKKAIRWMKKDDTKRASYMGICQLPTTITSTTETSSSPSPALHRRIDLKMYAEELLPYATLYFTGSNHFNRDMRLYAKKRGFLLSDKGLVYVGTGIGIEEEAEEGRHALPHPSPSPSPYSIGQSIHCHSEEEIFQVLGLQYKTPEQRELFDESSVLPV